MGSYPPSSSIPLSVPSGSEKPTRIARVLQPRVVLTMITVLLICSVLGLGIGIARFKEERLNPLPASIAACQGFMAVSVCSHPSILIVFTDQAKVWPHDYLRPTSCRLCDIQRADWTSAATEEEASWVLYPTSKAESGLVGSMHHRIVCCGCKTWNMRKDITRMFPTDSRSDRRQSLLVGINASKPGRVLTFCSLGTGILLTTLYTTKYPFEMPEAFTTGVTCRVSSFGDDLFDRNVSAISSFETISSREQGNLVVKEQPMVIAPYPTQTVPGEYPLERRATELFRLIPASQASNWRNEVKDLVSNATRVDSAIDIQEDRGSGQNSGSSDQGSNPPYPQLQVQRQRLVKPSSCICQESQRAPLSRIRSAEFPSILVEPEVRYVPVSIPPPALEWTSSRGNVSSSTQTIDFQTQQKQPTPPKPRRPNLYTVFSGPAIRKSAPVTVVRRKTTEIKIPGAFVDYQGKVDEERKRKVEEHARTPEAETVVRTQRHEKEIALQNGHQLNLSHSLAKRWRNNKQRAARNQQNSSGEMGNGAHEKDADIRPLRRIQLVDNGPVGVGYLAREYR